jgi:hypothetical protein
MDEFVVPKQSCDKRSLRITTNVYEAIRLTLGRLPAEQGGILGGNWNDGIVTHYYFDRRAKSSRGSYSPNHTLLNWLLAHEWNPRGIRMLGFVHSQPRGCTIPSIYDVEYALKILECNPTLDSLYLPIVQSAADHCPFGIYAYRVRARVPLADACESLPLELVPPEYLPLASETLVAESTTEASVAIGDQDSRVSVGESTCPPAGWITLDQTEIVGQTFARVQGAVDLHRMALSRVICVGVGGAAEFVENLARCGVGSFVLIDPDIASETNLGTQGVYRPDLGKPKVVQLARRLRQINPCVQVIAIAQPLDALDDTQFARLLRRPVGRWMAEVADYWGVEGLHVPARVTLTPAVVLLCGCTDSFAAQARINRLALHFGLPSLCAQLYAEGRGGEVTFTYPGVTPACHRCALKMRYDAYASGNVPAVTSRGTPIFSTARLNALKGFIALALLHYGTHHPRWGRWLEQVKNRNLVQIRMDPDLELRVFEKTFATASSERIYCDETLWLPQVPRRAHDNEPACPDCGGTGDLRHSIGKFQDTRVMLS